MGEVLKPGTVVGDARIVELAGDGSQSNVYLAERGKTFVWLIQVEDPNWEPEVRYGNVERFEAGDKWVMVGVNGTTMVNLASWVDQLELPFIGWEWAKLARTFGYMHARGAVGQDPDPLALDRLVFNTNAELILEHRVPGETDQYTFPAPDNRSALTPAADVYALGASLKALAGDNAPRGVQEVLRRATDSDPLKRYPNGEAFAQALGGALPNPNREKVAVVRPKRTGMQWLMMASLLACGGVALCVGLLVAVFYLQPSLILPNAVALQANPMQLEILKWQVEGGCIARMDVRVVDDGQPVTGNDGVLFNASTTQETQAAVNAVATGQPGESTLTFPLNEFCKTGGALTIRAVREQHTAESTVYYYPPDEDKPVRAALYKPGGSQMIIRRGGPGRLYFGLATVDGGPADLRGAIKIRLLQDGEEVHDFHLRQVNPATDPLVAVLVMDTSTSMLDNDAMMKAKQAASNFIDKLQPKDYVCLYSFATKVQVSFLCATDREGAHKAIDKLAALGNTALYDVLAIVGKSHEDKADRQAIILLSDGADNSSKESYVNALSEVVKTNVPVYVIGLQNKELAPQVLQDIADKTGGEYLQAPTPDDLDKLYANLQARFANQYQIEFQSIYPDRKSGTLELIVDDGNNPITIKKYFQVQQ